ncbi:MAG: hypothetical protein PHC85_00660 [Candidatus Pacebacteria bacterium]|nr:hypothetical protein [Candidatus Paceibacterota bacterium]
MNPDAGFIKLLIIIIIAVLILSAFNIDLRGFLTSDEVKGNFSFLWQSVKDIWNGYLINPANFVWSIFYNYIWVSFMDNMERIKGGEQPKFIEEAPVYQ